MAIKYVFKACGSVDAAKATAMHKVQAKDLWCLLAVHHSYADSSRRLHLARTCMLLL